jgi:predicted Zn-dependent protease
MNRDRIQLRHRAALLLIALSLPIWLALPGCARNPVTGRPEAVLTTEKGEVEQGDRYAKEVAEQMRMVSDPALTAYVSALGQRVAKHSPRPNITHHFYVIDMVEPNAFALPGGHIYISRGLLSLVNSEDELATVIGHEIGHVAARHSVSRQTANAPLLPVKIAAGIGGAAASIVSPTVGALISGVGQLPGALAMAAYSRDQEREADELGQQYASEAGFDPEALSSFMHSLAREEELAGNDPNRASFFRSHPTSPSRSTDAAEYAHTLSIAGGQPPPLNRGAFLGKLEGLIVGAAAIDGVFMDDHFMQPELGIGLRLPKDWKMVNSPQAVIAQHQDEKAQLVLQISGEGTDPMQAAREFAKEVRLGSDPTALQISGLPGARAVTDVGRGRERARVHLTWIAHGGMIYRITGAALEATYPAVAGEFDKSASSFHELTDKDRKEIRENRLRVTKGRKGESLEQICERSENAWSVEQTAVSNGIEAVDAPLDQDFLLKIARPEPYKTMPKPAGR